MLSRLTANGETNVTLTKAATVRLGRLQANDVPMVVVGKPLGQADGLLGRSFLSRFEMTISGHRLSLRQKT